VPEIGAPKGITKHIDLTDKEVAGVIDHAAASVTPAKLKAVDAPADDEVPAYNALQGLFEWKARGAMAVHDKTYHTSPTLPDTDAHKTASPIDHPDGSITNAKIVAAAGIPYSKLDLALSILNADIAAAAGIAGSKLADNSITSAKLSFGTWEKVAEVNVSADCSYVDFTGLDINTDKCYKILGIIKCANVQSGYKLTWNGDNVEGNYMMQWFGAYGVEIYAGSGYYARVATTINVGSVVIFETELMLGADGYGRFRSNSGADPAFGIEDFAVYHLSSDSNITTARISATGTNGIGAGSILILCKVRTK